MAKLLNPLFYPPTTSPCALVIVAMAAVVAPLYVKGALGHRPYSAGTAAAAGAGQGATPGPLEDGKGGLLEAFRGSLGVHQPRDSSHPQYRHHQLWRFGEKGDAGEKGNGGPPGKNGGSGARGFKGLEARPGGLGVKGQAGK